MDNNTDQKSDNMAWVYIIVVLVVVGGMIYFATRPKENVDLLENNEINQVEEQTTNTNNDTGANTQTGADSGAQNNTNNSEVVSKVGDVLVMNYTGRLTNGTVFDSNVDPKFGHVEPFVFVLGAGQVIQGWDEGLVGMKVGEKKTLTIAPEKAYGNRAIGSIPANSTLIFDVEVVAINPKN